MRKIILTAAILSVALPTMASAQTGELRQDRREIREQQRDLRDAQMRGDRHDIRDARGDLREARQEHREDWQDYRREHRQTYARGNWRAPFRYQRFSEGVRLRPVYYSSRYYIVDAGRYRLPAAYGPLRWVRHYDDALLVNIRTGRVVRVINGFYW